MANWSKYRRGYKKGNYSPRRANKNGRKSSNSLSAWIITPRMLRNSIWVIEQMEEKEEGKFEVKSSSQNSNIVYHFTADECDCPGFKKRGYCKHTIAATLYRLVKVASKKK